MNRFFRYIGIGSTILVASLALNEVYRYRSIRALENERDNPKLPGLWYPGEEGRYQKTYQRAIDYQMDRSLLLNK